VSLSEVEGIVKLYSFGAFPSTGTEGFSDSAEAIANAFCADRVGSCAFGGWKEVPLLRNCYGYFPKGGGFGDKNFLGIKIILSFVLLLGNRINRAKVVAGPQPQGSQ